MSSFSLSAQKMNSYLIIKIEKRFDRNFDRKAFTINAERGCDSAKNIYNLINYNFKRESNKLDSSLFYYEKKEGNEKYNYFLSTTEALNFISYNGWKLLFIFSEITTDLVTENNNVIVDKPINKISSIPVYYFEKLSAK